MRISTIKFIVMATLINMFLYHMPLYDYVIKNLNISSTSGMLTFASVLISIIMITMVILLLLAIFSSRLVKYFTIFMMITNAIALYFIVTYHTILDITMMGNLFNTNIAEATSYYQSKIFLYIIFLGIIPAFIVSKIRINKTKRVRLFFYAFMILTIGVLSLYLNASTWLWLDKNAKKLGAMTMPWSYTINSIRYKANELKKNKKQILLPSATLMNDDKMIVLLVIGESARAKNFSLYGYKKKTNPYLQNVKNINIVKAKSTATYTTASIHSMLSYKGLTSDDYEPLPNYLQRTGVDVLWRSNNWGEPTLDVKTVQKAGNLKTLCKTHGCNHDEVLLTRLKEEILKNKKNKIFVVLHTNGSHGPTYYKKYSKEFEKFKPVCKTVDLKECTQEELINAYDNTILYADHFLNRTINILKQIKNSPTLFIYISDHGESLGEYGLYLHGTPYSIAPDVQKNIPFIIWASNSFIAIKGNIREKIDTKKIYGQNNIFHTILGAFDINSSIYDPKLDLLH
ncbi:membrane protein [hydrothermal vent metagenome]|uniref:Membrane protein n=1 Tax=hydrothermal vent metagenome TaxID=652676 RepID=A0A3B1E727_9ZZZZ